MNTLATLTRQISETAAKSVLWDSEYKFQFSRLGMAERQHITAFPDSEAATLLNKAVEKEVLHQLEIVSILL